MMERRLRRASFPRTPTGASFARHFVAEALRGWMMSEEQRLDFILAVGEAISNAVRHDGGEKFSIRCWNGDGSISADVIDSGSGLSSIRLATRCICSTAAAECGS